MGGTPTRGGGLDDGIANLEAFIGQLQEAITGVGEATPTIAEHADGLEELAGTGVLDELDGELDEGRQAVDSGADQAVEALEAVTEAARGGADDRLPEVSSDIEAAEKRLADAASDGAEDVRERGNEVVSDGFEEADGDAREASEGLTSARGQVEAAFETLRSRIRELAERFEGALTAAGEKFADAAEATRALDSSVEAKGTGAAGELESGGSSFAEAVAGFEERSTTLYGRVKDTAEGEGQSFAETMAAVLRETLEDVQARCGQPLLEPMDLLIEGGLGSCATELESWVETAFHVKGALIEFESLVEDLAACQRVVDKIARVLDELGG